MTQDVDTVRPLVETYIGALTTTDRTETFIDREVHPPQGKTVKQIEKLQQGSGNHDDGCFCRRLRCRRVG